MTTVETRAVTLDGMKRQAKKLKKAVPGVTHTQALEEIARNHGYSSYHEAQKVLRPETFKHPFGETEK